MKKFIVFLIIVLIGFGVYFLITGDKSSENGTGGEQKSSESVPAALKTFDVSGENFSFSLKEIRVKKGDKVRINFTSAGGFHDWAIDEFNAKTDRVENGGKVSVEFTADKAGTFEYYCSVGQHRQNGMKGQLIVE
ncbi:MAG: cupredoxin domain-containing protein [Candidatus Pacebacteria bacterium]|nr:cupredoxin domain-containing protein [Candidatus Paceibacterota bacterium]NUQ57267.1 cupredoxin domain-containing protein [Candidatus Paceibacter sp.]